MYHKPEIGLPTKELELVKQTYLSMLSADRNCKKNLWYEGQEKMLG